VFISNNFFRMNIVIRIVDCTRAKRNRFFNGSPTWKTAEDEAGISYNGTYFHMMCISLFKSKLVVDRTTELILVPL